MKTKIDLLDSGRADGVDEPFLCLELIPENDAENVLLKLMTVYELHPHHPEPTQNGGVLISFSEFPAAIALSSAPLRSE